MRWASENVLLQRVGNIKFDKNLWKYRFMGSKSV
jgi:hypothetical protein